MADNQCRQDMLKKLVSEYQVQGIIDLALSTCHAYTVEQFTMKSFSKTLGIPEMALETSFSDSDEGQINTRISAFLEML